ncbi:MAG: FAD-binding oxidoreductase [Nanoarchaeota archaeon]|nr:FAD-binding oxidoreductase [Nanoarchaeota archaeon]
MEETKIKLLMKEFVTHDVLRYVFEKPDPGMPSSTFEPGQATELALDIEELKDQWRPFTFTSSPEDSVLEFIIKTYPDHEGVTKRFYELEKGDFVRIKEAFGTIKYQDKGVFIAAGAGITPFISILRKLKEEGKIKGNFLLFSNKAKEDIILEKEFRDMFPEGDLILTLTREDKKEEGYEYGRINREFIGRYVKDFSQNFYICGPKIFVKQIRDILEEEGAKSESVVFEGKQEN